MYVCMHACMYYVCMYAIRRADRYATWEERYLPRLHPPCVVDWLCGYTWHIKVPVFVIMLDKDRDNSPLWCACMRGTSLGVLSAGRILLMVIGWFACGGGPVDCSDWTRVDCAVDFSPGGVWIGYIRKSCGTDLQLMPCQ